ncbi:YqjF family protein [Lysinibacillus sp. NPDC048646]|uniref:YqjF family protein n=1 Tax=Lysinibacillus sp. NPDC048646 TaxID=3390574 RepID=UPI003D031202
MWKKPWLVTQKWQDVVFLHWPIPPHDLQQHIPKELNLDVFEKKAWLGIVIFQVKGHRLRFMPPIPRMSSFLQINVRTYVTYREKKGIYFFSSDVSRAVIAQIASIGHFFPYRHAEITLGRMGNIRSFLHNYRNTRNMEESFQVTFEPMAAEIESHAFERWLVERYHSWIKRKKNLFRIDISHMPWRLQRVNAFVETNTMAPFIKSAIQDNQPIAYYAKSRTARIFPPILET